MRIIKVINRNSFVLIGNNFKNKCNLKFMNFDAMCQLVFTKRQNYHIKEQQV